MITVEKYTEITQEVINLIENALHQLFIKKTRRLCPFYGKW